MAGYLHEDIAGALALNPPLSRSMIGLDLIVGGVPLQGIAMRSARVGAAGSGYSDAYTCPHNKRALVVDCYAHNATLGSITAAIFMKRLGAYYPLTVSAVLGAGATVGFMAAPFVLEPNEVISFNANAAGANVWFKILEYDKTVGLYSPRALGLAAGDNVLYECPARRGGVLLGATTLSPANGTNSIIYLNGSSGSVTRTLYVAPAGETPSSSNRAFPPTAIAAGAASQMSFRAGTLEAGDRVVLNVDSGAAGQVAWCNVAEIGQ